MIQAIVYKTAGDPAVAGQIVRGLTAPENRRLRAENARLREQRALYWDDRIHALRREYKGKVKARGRLYKWFWGRIGMLILLREERRARRNDHR